MNAFDKVFNEWLWQKDKKDLWEMIRLAIDNQSTENKNASKGAQIQYEKDKFNLLKSVNKKYKII